MNRKLSFIAVLLVVFTILKSQRVDSLIINYYDNFPYAYSEAGKLKGIEIDIIEEYVAWLKLKKNITVITSYKPYKEFGTFYNSVKDGSSKGIGLGSVTINAEREQEVQFSPPYLQNVAVLITNGAIPTVRTKTAEEVSKILGGLRAMVVNKSSHINYLNDIKKQFVPGLTISFAESQHKVLENIISDKTIFGYVDIIAYWSFLKASPGKFLKIQKIFTEPKEYLGFTMPKKSVHSAYINEFFESGFGFTSTKVYHELLEKYLGYEIIGSVEIK